MKKPLGKKMEFFRQYDEVLFNQLEKKILDLETANQRFKILAKEYRAQFENISDVVFMIGTDFKIASISPSIEKLLGYKAEDFISRPVSDLKRIFTTESFKKAIANTSKMLKGERIPATTYEVVAKDGTLKHVEINGAPLIHDGQVAGTISVARDMTERKRANEDLHVSEERFRLLSEATFEAIAIHEEGFLLHANDQYFKMFGYEPDEALGKEMISLTFDPEVLAFVKKRVATDSLELFETIGLRKDGTRFPMEIRTRKMEYNGRIVRFGAIRDITERKLVEEALRESEQSLASIYNTVGDVIFQLAVEPAEQFRVVSVNSAFLKITGLSRERVVGRTVNEIIREPSLTMALGKYRQAIAEKTIVRWEEISDYPTGRLTGIVSVAPVFNDKGTCTHLVGSVQDITERKREEEAVKEAELKFRTIFDAASDGILLLNVEDGKFSSANKKICNMLEYTNEELLNLGISDIHPQESVPFVIDQIEKQLKEDILVAKNIPVIKKDKTVFFADISSSPITLDGKEYLLGVFRDITEHKLAEEKILTSLREKNILIKEIHHRVKNNLQVIYSLLGLQARSSENPELTEMFNEIQGRIRSMAMIHETLYDTNDFTRIELSRYVKDLSQSLFNTHNIHQGKIDLAIQTDGKIYVDVTKAIPCGLVLNELISNALKHAFPGDRKGYLQIIISETENTEIAIVVCDNGVGMPDNIDTHEPQTLGLELVNGLVKNQLNGQIEVRRDNGTEVRINFPV